MVTQRITRIPNETQNRKALAGYETIPGVAVTPTFLLPGTYESNVDFPDATEPEATGTLDTFVTPQKGQPVFAGTYGENVSYQTLPRLMRVAHRSGDPAVLVSGAAAAYEREQAPNPAFYDVDRWTVEHFLPGLGFRDRGISFGNWNISGDTDDAANVWKFAGDLFMLGSDELPGSYEGTVSTATATTITVTGAGWTVDEHAGKYINVGVNHVGQIRLIESNTADTLTVGTAFDPVPAVGQLFRIEGRFTAGVARQNVEKISMRGTKLYLDPVGEIGTTQVRRRFISFNITENHNLSTKVFADTPEGEIDRESPGHREITYQVRLEFDRRDEWLQWKRNQTLALRIQQEGTEIETGVNYLARLDLPKVSWTGVTKGERASNITATFAGRAYLPESDPILTVYTVNNLAAV